MPFLMPPSLGFWAIDGMLIDGGGQASLGLMNLSEISKLPGAHSSSASPCAAHLRRPVFPYLLSQLRITPVQTALPSRQSLTVYSLLFTQVPPKMVFQSLGVDP